MTSLPFLDDVSFFVVLIFELLVFEQPMTCADIRERLNPVTGIVISEHALQRYVGGRGIRSPLSHKLTARIVLEREILSSIFVETSDLK